MDYTMIGDGVNLRLDSRALPSSIVLDCSLVNSPARLKGTYRLREVDSVVVRQTEPVKIHEVWIFTPRKTRMSMMFWLASESSPSLFEQHWDDAIAAFNDVLKLNRAMDFRFVEHVS